LLKGITKEFIPAPTYGIETKATTGEILARFCTKLVGRYDHAPEISQLPFMVANQYGRGKAVYLAGTFGISLSNFRFPEYLTLTSNLAAKLSSTAVTVKKAPWVEVNVRRNDDTLYVHLVNQTSGLKRPLTHIQTLTDVEVLIPSAKYKQARTLRSHKKLKTRTHKDATSFVIPILDDYEIIELPLRK
jgi:hypothetical protein